MRVPGFSADASLSPNRHQYRGATPATFGPVTGQLKISPFPRAGGVYGTIGDYWVCRDGCETSYRNCLNGCEGTWATPKGSMNCVICDQDFRACLNGCAGDIA